MSAAPSQEAVLVLGCVALAVASGLPTLVRRKGEGAARLGTVLAVASGAFALAAGISGLFGGVTVLADVRWSLPLGRVLLALDPLSAAFLLPVAVVFPLASVYGLGYEHGPSAHRSAVRLFSGLLAASIVLVTVARDGVLFLVAWEVMALSAFFLASVDHGEPEVRRAGLTYLVATHAGTLSLTAMVLVMRATTGTTSFVALPSGAAGSAVVLLALAGFGGKAGLFPLHFWLPGAHAGAPSHASALLSAVMLKTGLYGILRVTGLLPQVPAWLAGLVLLGGAATAASGVVLAVGQGDLKRSLAYSSVENVGIVATGIGLAMAGRAFDRPVWVLLGIAAAVFHTWVHALFKTALFLGAGAVLHATGTRAVDRLGGLLRRMPRTGAAFVLAAGAAAVLPPFGAFASEWLLYGGLLRSFLNEKHPFVLAPVAIVALVLSGGVAVTAFVRLVGTVFLGEPRTEAAREATEPPATMRVPVLLAAAGSAAIGLLLPFLSPALERVAAAWSGASGPAAEPLREAAALVPLSGALWGTLLCLAAAGALVARDLRGAREADRPTWDCGYAAPRPTMQYTGRSFAEWISERLSPPLFAARTRVERPEGLFPSPGRFSSETPEPVGERLLGPFLLRAADRLSALRALQHGRLSSYLAVPVATLLLLMAWNAVRPLLGWP